MAVRARLDAPSSFTRVELSTDSFSLGLSLEEKRSERIKKERTKKTSTQKTRTITERGNFLGPRRVRKYFANRLLSRSNIDYYRRPYMLKLFFSLTRTFPDDAQFHIRVAIDDREEKLLSAMFLRSYSLTSGTLLAIEAIDGLGSVKFAVFCSVRHSA